MITRPCSTFEIQLMDQLDQAKEEIKKLQLRVIELANEVAELEHKIENSGENYQ